MKTKVTLAFLFALALMLSSAVLATAQSAAGANASASRPNGPCDIYDAAGDPCVAAHSTTRALYASYNGPLYQVLRQSDGKTLDIGVVQASSSDAGGYADASAQDKFCARHILLDHHHLRSISQAQQPYAGAPRRIQRPRDGRLQQPSDRRHGANHDHGPQSLWRLHRAGHGASQ